MTGLRGHIYRLFSRIISPHRIRVAPARRFNGESTHVQTGSTANRPRARDYYSRREIATLFFQPLFLIVLYIALVWNGLKYYCNVSSLDDILRTLRWKYTTYTLGTEKRDLKRSAVGSRQQEYDS